VFEEAAGIVKYKARKLDAEKRIAHTQDNLNRVEDILSELEERVEPLKKQSEAAREYLQLRDELEARGYKVIMVRETNEVDISNSERADVANRADADAFIRIHANGSDNHGATGAMTICQTPGNIYNGDLYADSRALSDCVLNAYTAATGIDYEYVWETDTMSGINWCSVPVTIVEMGYMTNSEEDMKMQDPQFQEKMTDGIADGIDAFMADRTPKEH
jgi:N-acetylmuramoyl-L-alanine amidase